MFFIISAQLSSIYTLTVTITDVNDEAPSCGKFYNVRVPENSGPAVVKQLKCMDADATSPNNEISAYSIVSGNTGN